MKRKLHLYLQDAQFRAVLDGERTIVRPCSEYYTNLITRPADGARVIKRFDVAVLHNGKKENHKSIHIAVLGVATDGLMFTISLGDIIKLVG